VTWPKRNPAPLAGGGRAPDLVLASDLDGPEDRPAPRSVQAPLPDGFVPQAFPIIARHWFGLTLEA
jgi:hypothetical protein